MSATETQERKGRRTRPAPKDHPHAFELQSNWREYQDILSERTIAIAEENERRGHHVFVMDCDIRSHKWVICPVENQPYVIGFRDTEGRWREEMTVQFQENALSINYTGDDVKSRPPYPTFTIGNGLKSYHPSVEREYPGVDGETLKAEASEWLCNRDLIIIPYFADDGLVFGEFVAPRELAQALQQGVMLHRVPSYAEMKTLKRSVNSTFLCAPGLRHSLFEGRQNVTLFPEQDGSMLGIGNSVYDGLLLGKKWVFNDIAWKRYVSGGMALHASIATVRAVGSFAKVLTAVALFAFAMICESGRGKTELRKLLAHYFAEGRLLLGFRRNERGELKSVTIPYTHELLLEYVSQGDDGVSVRKLLGKSLKHFIGINWEKGAFDRNSGAFGEGDIIELDNMQRLSRGWWELRMVNIVAAPGDFIEHWNRVLLENGQPCGNPRLTYSNKLLARAGVANERKRRPIKNAFFAFSRVNGVTAVGPWTKLPAPLAVLYEILGGPDAFRSKSIAQLKPPAGKASRAVPHRSAKFSHFGTMGQFSPVPVYGQVAQAMLRHLHAAETQYWLVMQEERPSAEELGRRLTTAEEEIEYLPECLLRDLLVLEEIEKAKLTWAVSPYPFLGYWPTSVTVGGHRIPREFFRPELIYGESLANCAQNWFKEICEELDQLEERGVSPEAVMLFDWLRNMYGPDRVVRPLSAQEAEAILNAGVALCAELRERGISQYPLPVSQEE